MGEIWKRLSAMLLTLAMLCSLLPAGVNAASDEKWEFVDTQTQTESYINPLYSDVMTQEDLADPDPLAVLPIDGTEYHTDLNDTGDDMREAMLLRQETIVVGYTTTAAQDTETLHRRISVLATAHTGVPTEGDYLAWQYGGYKVSTRTTTYYSASKGYRYEYTLTYTMTYYTTAAQEEKVDVAVAELLDSLELEGKSDYQKLCAVYDYICANITYDYDNTYKLKHTAYAALINKTAVCQGYAVLLYRLALEMGIDCRFISGTGNGGGHGWNIIKLGDVYYNLDPTWDAIYMQKVNRYAYFLQCEETFTENGTDHFRDAEYDTAEFHSAYPISETDFDPAVDDQPEVELFTIPSTNMTLGNSLAMNFWVNEADIVGEDYYAQIVKTYADGREDAKVQIPFSEWKYNSGYKMYYFTFDGIAAKEMGDELYVTVYTTDGTQVSETKTDSIRDYVVRNIGKWTGETRTMGVDMLNYGAAAQSYFEYDAENPANAGMDDYQQYATQSVAMTDNRVKSTNYVGSTLKLESSIVLGLYFQNLTRDMNAVVTFTDHYGNEKTMNIPGSEFDTLGNYLGVEVDELVIADGSQLVTCVIYDADGNEVARAVDSVESYISRMSNLDALFEQIMKFSASSYAYFH